MALRPCESFAPWPCRNALPSPKWEVFDRRVPFSAPPWPRFWPIHRFFRLSRPDFSIDPPRQRGPAALLSKPTRSACRRVPVLARIRFRVVRAVASVTPRRTAASRGGWPPAMAAANRPSAGVRSNSPAISPASGPAPAATGVATMMAPANEKMSRARPESAGSARVGAGPRRRTPQSLPPASRLPGRRQG